MNNIIYLIVIIILFPNFSNERMRFSIDQIFTININRKGIKNILYKGSFCAQQNFKNFLNEIYINNNRKSGAKGYYGFIELEKNIKLVRNDGIINLNCFFQDSYDIMILYFFLIIKLKCYMEKLDFYFK